MPRYRVTITSRDRNAMLDLVRVHRISVFDHGVKHSATGEYRVDAAADDADISKLRGAGYEVDPHEDLDQLGRARQNEVGRGDRYQDRVEDTRND